MSQNEIDTMETMADVSHTNPYTGETAGRLFNRGPIVATDGGERPAEDDRSSGRKPAASDSNGDDDGTDSTGDRSTDTMADVEHTPPNESEDANRVFERGQQPADAVEDDE